MFRRYSLFESTTPRLSVLNKNNSNNNDNSDGSDNGKTPRKMSLGAGMIPEIRVNQAPVASKQITALQQRKSRSLSNSPVYRKKKYDNLPVLIDHYYDYTPEDLDAIVKKDQEKKISERNAASASANNDDNDDKTDGLRHSHHVSRRSSGDNQSKSRRNLNSFGNSIGLTRHRRLQMKNDESMANQTHTIPTTTTTSNINNCNNMYSRGLSGGVGIDGHSLSKDNKKPLQQLVFNTNKQQQPQTRLQQPQHQQEDIKEKRCSSPVHSCLLVRRRSDFSDPSFANLPPLLNSLKVS